MLIDSLDLSLDFLSFVSTHGASDKSSCGPNVLVHQTV